MTDIIELKPCPFCGEQPEVETLGTFIEIGCCASMSIQKSDYLTIEERETWNNEAASFDAEVEKKAYAEAYKCWNTRTQLLQQGEAVATLALKNTELNKRISVLEDLLSSAYNIANRNGENTHWERFAGQLHIHGINPVTPKTFKILPSDENYTTPQSTVSLEEHNKRIAELEADIDTYVPIANQQATEIMQLQATNKTLLDALQLAKITFIANKMDVRNVMEIINQAIADAEGVEG